MSTKEIGNLGEKIALHYLKKKGYQILDKNYFFSLAGSSKRGEIDIVVKRGKIISFVEVKTLTINKRQDLSHLIFPEEKINSQKQRRLIKIAESWLIRNKISLNSPWQIDAISIKIDLNSKKAKIRHLQNIA